MSDEHGPFAIGGPEHRASQDRDHSLSDLERALYGSPLLEIRICALDLAMDLHKGQSVDAHQVLHVARQFEEYLKGC